MTTPEFAVVETNSLDAEALAAFGEEVRELRRARQMTLSRLAEISGVSISHLSAIERGAVNASANKVAQIANALAVPPEWFFARREGAGPLERTYVVRKEERRNLNVLYGETPEERESMDWLLSSSIGSKFHLGISHYPPAGETIPDTLYVRDGEQHVVVLEGQMTLRLEGEEIELYEGDSYSIPGNIPHAIRNTSDKRAKMIWVNSPVIIPKDAAIEEGAPPGGNLIRVVT